MIKLNGKTIEGKKFPDGTLSIFDFPIESIGNSVNIEWQYENDNEFFLLFCCVKHIKQNFKNTEIVLKIPYVYGARMDRVKKPSEVFTLKYFADFINSLNFDCVYVFDPHSDVSAALINNIQIMSPESMIETALNKIHQNEIESCFYDKRYEEIVLYYPDYGAKKRYSSLKRFENYKSVYGCKTRDWETGQITGLKICDKDGIVIDYSKDKDILKDKIVLMIDDIVSYGGTLAYSADAIKEYGAKAIYAYVSHAENSVLDEEKSTLLKRLEDGTVKCLFTTNSIYRGDSKYIESHNII